MGRVAVFGTMGNGQGCPRTMGGRRGPVSSAWAKLNTDNGGQSNCAVTIRAEVEGDAGGYVRKRCDCGHRFQDNGHTERACPDCGEARGGLDTRVSRFVVELPKQADEFCQVEIGYEGHAMRELVHIGALLCGVKAAQDAAAGRVEEAKRTIKGASDILRDMEKAEHPEPMPNVTLPGGVSLVHALRCVEVVRRLTEQETNG